jgi:hypothetical protein
VGPPRAFDLGRVLAGPRQAARVLAAQHLRARARQRLEVPGRRLRGIDQHPLALQVGERLRQVGRGLQPHLVAEPGPQLRRQLLRIEEQPRRAVGVQHRLAER